MRASVYTHTLLSFEVGVVNVASTFKLIQDLSAWFLYVFAISKPVSMVHVYPLP